MMKKLVFDQLPSDDLGYSSWCQGVSKCRRVVNQTAIRNVDLQHCYQSEED